MTPRPGVQGAAPPCQGFGGSATENVNGGLQSTYRSARGPCKACGWERESSGGKGWAVGGWQRATRVRGVWAGTGPARLAAAAVARARLRERAGTREQTGTGEPRHDLSRRSPIGRRRKAALHNGPRYATQPRGATAGRGGRGREGRSGLTGAGAEGSAKPPADPARTRGCV